MRISQEFLPCKSCGRLHRIGSGTYIEVYPTPAEPTYHYVECATDSLHLRRIPPKTEKPETDFNLFHSFDSLSGGSHE